MSQTIAVLGPGSWGTALSQVLAENGHTVRLWGNDPNQIQEIAHYHTNRHYLPDLKIPTSISATTDLKEALENVDAVLFVVPTKVIRSVASDVAKLLTNQPVIIHASKGLEQGTHLRISEILAQEIPADKRRGIAVLSGPSHAEEVAVHDLTTITAACEDLAIAKYVQDLFMNEYFRIYTNTDVIGVELGAALKNIIALGTGALVGLGYGDNAKAAIMTRGLAEISRLGEALGADPLTFIGLSGVGDLIVTGTSKHSRNWRAGYQLGQGIPLEEVLDKMGMVVEGVATTKSAYELAQNLNVEMPITETIYHVLYDGANVKEVTRNLMLRDGRQERE